MDFWALIFGLLATIIGGYAFCYGFVILGERIIHLFRAKRAAEPSIPPIRKAA